ncbi:Pro-Pol polyprotein [Dictyocoela muelleri]|nr:Pro-Pol polyprotein [Dictyocoela muelleri]
MKSNKIYIITITDRCSRFTKCRFISNIRADDFIRAFNEEWLSEFKIPQTILSDNGLCYVSKKTKNYMKSKGIKQIFTTPYNPTGNSISERINQIITKILRIYKGWNLEQIKIIIENRINKIVNTSFGNSPEEILKFNKQAKDFHLNENKYENKNQKVKNKNRKYHRYKNTPQNKNRQLVYRTI